MTDPDPAFLWETEALRDSHRRSSEATATRPSTTGWATLTEAHLATGIPTGTLRKWARREHVPSRMIDTPHGERRILDMNAVIARAAELGREIGPVEAEDGDAAAEQAAGTGHGEVADGRAATEEVATGAGYGEARDSSAATEERPYDTAGHGELADGRAATQEATKERRDDAAEHGELADGRAATEEATKERRDDTAGHGEVRDSSAASEQATKEGVGRSAAGGSVGGDERGREPAPAGTMIVPIDAWEKMLLQLGNLHEAGQQLAEARERAAKAETEARFLRERLTELRARPEAASATESAPIDLEDASASPKPKAAYVSGEPWGRPPVIETWWQYVERRIKQRRRRR